MFGRPRCREWTPLATQQLRLRSLIQIVGYNIRPPEWCVAQCSFYITLHHTTMSAPFYTSERICSPHPKWKEIDSEVTQQISASNVVIRIWCHTQQGKTEDSGDKPNDTILQTWGVYFSGLRYIGANLALNFTSDCFKSNTLVFQMHGGYFCSYKSLKLDIIPGEEAEHGSLSSDSSGKTASKTIETKFLHHHKFKESRSISPNKFSRKVEKEYSKSQSPVDRSFKQNFPTIKTSTSLNINHKDRRYRENSTERRKQDPNYIYEHSPDNLDVMTSEGYVESLSKNASQEDLTNSRIDLSETAENYDLRNESDGVPKYRYLALNFLKSEIRPSYNATKLQKLHLLQYSIKKRQEAVQEIKERIYKKSALTQEMPVEIDVKSRFKSRSQRNIFSPDEEVLTARCSSQSDLREREDTPPVSNGPRLALKLNDLLYYKAKPSPFQRAEHVRMTKQLEILRFKRIILVDERDSKLASIRRLKETHAKLAEENQDLGLELMENYHSLSRRNEDLREMRSSCGALRELSARSHAALCSVRSELMLRVHGIFYIQQKDETTWTIIDVPLPICGDDSPRTSSPVSDSVAAGFAAQAICLTAAILNQPLRYKITLLGSATKILDITPDLPDPNIPLFARGGDAILFRYGMFLLNKCLAQLLWARHLPCADMRPTLHNLHTLLTRTATASSKTLNCEWSCASRTQSLRSLVAGDRGKNTRQFNRFKDAVDGQSPATVMNLRRHRHSRSVGSYNDDQELPNFDASTTSIMGSEPNIYDTKLANASVPQIIPKHNSDTEISRLSVDQNDHKEKVIFTLGDDLNIDVTESEHLVKISSNNGDQMSKTIEDVKQICTEIKDFCTDAVETKNISPDIDIAKYMEQKTESLEESCIDCEFACEGVCDIVCAKNVTDVIVIPSAEAVLASEATEERTDDQNT